MLRLTNKASTLYTAAFTVDIPETTQNLCLNTFIIHLITYPYCRILQYSCDSLVACSKFFASGYVKFVTLLIE